MRRLLAALLLVLLLGTPAAADNSHFGFFGTRLSLEGNYLEDLGAGFVHAILDYKLVYDSTTGTWKFQKFDSLYSQLTSRGVQLVLTLQPPNNIDKVRSQNFALFLTRATERYDGDANYGCTLDAPDCYAPGDGLYPVWTDGARPDVKYWQAGNEMDVNPYWLAHPGAYREFLFLVYAAAKAARPDSEVLLGSSCLKGLNAQRQAFHKKVAALAAPPFDILDIHLFGEMNRDHFAGYTSKVQAVSAMYPGKPIWMSETATYSDQPYRDDGSLFPPQYELKQAVALLKRYVHFASLGVDNIFWDYLYETTFGPTLDGFFWYSGLVYDGVGIYDKGLGVEKLAYYTYKQMVLKLAPATWNPTESSPAPNVYLYRYQLPSAPTRPLYVAWFDWFLEPGKTKQVSLYVGPLGEVTVTEAVPSVATGQEVTDFATAFHTYSVPVDADGYVTLTLGKRPVYIE